MKRIIVAAICMGWIVLAAFVLAQAAQAQTECKGYTIIVEPTATDLGSDPKSVQLFSRNGAWGVNVCEDIDQMNSPPLERPDGEFGRYFVIPLPPLAIDPEFDTAWFKAIAYNEAGCTLGLNETKGQMSNLCTIRVTLDNAEPGAPLMENEADGIARENEIGHH